MAHSEQKPSYEHLVAKVGHPTPYAKFAQRVWNWNFILLNEIVHQIEKVQPSTQNLKTTRFCYTKQPLNILCSFIVYFLWIDKCRKNFEDNYPSFKILKWPQVSNVEVGMDAWKDLSNTRTHETRKAKANLALIRSNFISTWCFQDLFARWDRTMRWSLLPLCITLILN